MSAGGGTPDEPVTHPSAAEADEWDGRPPLLQVRNLTKHYRVGGGLLRPARERIRAVDGISFDLRAGEALGIVGESGCGKSTAARTMVRLEEPTDGVVRFDGEDVGSFDATARRRFRRRVQMTFQDPDSSLDPRMTVGESVTEPLRVQGVADRERREEIARDRLARVGLEPGTYGRYPHELSQGQMQRIAIARALVLDPDVLVADEPVSALDVSIKAEILALLEELRATFDVAMVVISHDLGVVRRLCDRVAVMYLGQFVEVAPTERLFEDPRHPYTRALLAAVPRPDPHADRRAEPLGGTVPNPADPPEGCRFHTRCPEVIQPPDLDIEPSRWRRIVDFRVRLAEGEIDLEALRSMVRDRSGTVADDALESAVREELGFERRAGAGGDRAEAVVAEAIDALLDREPDRALAILDRELPTPCIRRQPALEGEGRPWPAACHLLDE